MIRIYGDIHGGFGMFNDRLRTVPEDYTVIQVGDMGIWPPILNEFFIEEGDKLIRPVYFIDGNHEYFPILTQYKEVIELTITQSDVDVYTNMIYIPRGTVMELDGRKILFFGGGDSPDKLWRQDGVSWFKEETITYKDMMKVGKEAYEVDFMVTHVPPVSVVHEIFGNNDAPAQWNYSSNAIETIWREIGCPPLYCGHLHMNRVVGNVTVLDEFSYIDV